MLGLDKRARSSRRLFSGVQENVMQIAHCPVVVARLTDSLENMKTILVPIETPSAMTLRVLRFAQVIATANQASITLLHVHSPRASEISRTRVKKQLEVLIGQLPPASFSISVELLARDNVVSAIAKAARQYDLVILRSQRRRSSGNGLTVGDRTAPLIQKLSGSLILVGEPHVQPNRATRRRPIDSADVSPTTVGFAGEPADVTGPDSAVKP